GTITKGWTRKSFSRPFADNYLCSYQNRGGSEEEQSDGKKRRVIGNDARLSGDLRTQHLHSGFGGGTCFHPVDGKLLADQLELPCDGDTAGDNVRGENRAIQRSVMIDQRLQEGHAEEPTGLPTNVEKSDPVSDRRAFEIEQGNQRDRQKEEAKCKTTQQDRGQQIGYAAFAVGSGQHPHGDDETENAKRHRCYRRKPEPPDQEGSQQKRSDEHEGARKEQHARLCRRHAED